MSETIDYKVKQIVRDIERAGRQLLPANVDLGFMADTNVVLADYQIREVSDALDNLERMFHSLCESLDDIERTPLVVDE